MSNVLDLSGANLKGFEPIPSGRYPAHVHDLTMVEVENPDGNLPQGTPGYNVQFRVDGGEYNNRVVFNRYWIPPADYNPEKAATMKGMFARFLMAIGYTEKEITSGKFKFDAEDAIGRECTIVVGVRPANEEKGYEAQNTVRNVLPLQTSGSDDDLL